MASRNDLDPWSAAPRPLQAPRYPDGGKILALALVGVVVFPCAIVAAIWSTRGKRACGGGQWTHTGTLMWASVISVLWLIVLGVGFLINLFS